VHAWVSHVPESCGLRLSAEVALRLHMCTQGATGTQLQAQPAGHRVLTSGG
jgi:hypothetical protein